MNLVTKEISIHEEILTLTNQRAIVWKREQTLVVSDLHIGKTAHFRKAGIAIPSTILYNDLQRLKFLIAYFQIQTILIVGDLFHAGKNKDIDVFHQWMLQFDTVKFELIKGNHDRLSQAFYASLNITIYQKYKDIAPFRFVHDATQCNSDHFCISGHTHPGAILKGRGKQFLKLPCFEVGENILVLPAFSEFTGLNTKKSSETSICFAFTESSLFKL
ncbi:MAG: ligase-associated DNA damage response endonuclease PdeM [Aquaticitalea sp.]